MAMIEVDPGLESVEVEGFRFPLGVYPIEPLEPMSGYVEEFEAADGGPELWSGDDAPVGDDWEEWPDRIMFDAVVSSERLPTLVRTLMSMLPTRVYPILDVLGNDAYREVDPYIAYDTVGVDRVLDGMRSYKGWLFEDGLVGFGAMSLEPFLYVFVDEHKIVTVRAELALKEKVEGVLGAFGLGSVAEIKGADAAAHEHRGVLLLPDAEHPHRVSSEEIVDRLRRHWSLQLNIDRMSNVDEEGKALGVTAWQAMVRVHGEEESMRYAEVWLAAGSYDEAESLALDAAEGDGGAGVEGEVVQLDRVVRSQAEEVLGMGELVLEGAALFRMRWLGEE